MDASNLLKPMLGRGELRCIGATTLVRPRICEGALCLNAGVSCLNPVCILVGSGRYSIRHAGHGMQPCQWRACT